MYRPARPGRFISGERVLGTHRIGGWVGPSKSAELIKHYAVKAYGGSGCIDPHILDPGTSRRWAPVGDTKANFYTLLLKLLHLMDLNTHSCIMKCSGSSCPLQRCVCTGMSNYNQSCEDGSKPSS
jgi:hypothetical protein